MAVLHPQAPAFRCSLTTASLEFRGCHPAGPAFLPELNSASYLLPARLHRRKALRHLCSSSIHTWDHPHISSTVEFFLVPAAPSLRRLTSLYAWIVTASFSEISPSLLSSFFPFDTLEPKILYENTQYQLEWIAYSDRILTQIGFSHRKEWKESSFILGLQNKKFG